jgi:hypothetical protein
MDTVAVVVAAVAVLVSIFFSIRSLGLARKALETSDKNHREAVGESARQAWDYLGAQQCAAYREQVLTLHERGLAPEEIKAWFALEKGGEENPQSHEGYATAYEHLAEGCGTVEDLVKLLPPK